jgi:hypothetical protein
VEGCDKLKILPFKDCKDNSTVIFQDDDIRNRLLKFNMTKSPGCDALHPIILKELSSVIAYPLKIIFDCSFDLNNCQWTGCLQM